VRSIIPLPAIISSPIVPNPIKLYTDITLEAKHENSSEILAKRERERENPRKNSNHTRTNQEREKRESGEKLQPRTASKHVVTGGGVRAGRAPR
jgi:hypothetical protein